MDAIDEIREWLEGETVATLSSHRDRAKLEILSETTNYQDINLREVIRGGIGNVNIGDVMTASRSNGMISCNCMISVGCILAYDVSVNPDALKLATAKDVKILYFNKMQVIPFHTFFSSSF